MSWTQNDWQVLLTKIRAGQVIPIIGKDLLSVKINSPGTGSETMIEVNRLRDEGEQEQGAIKPLYDWLCIELIRSNPTLNLNINDLYHLESLSSKVIRSSNKSVDDLKIEIAQLTENNPHKNFINLRKLAEITDFKLFINTTFTPYLSSELRDFYNKNLQEELAVYEVNYSPHSAFRNLKTVRLKDQNPSSVKNLSNRCVLNLFGDYDENDQTTFLLTDSEIVDLMVHLLVSNEWKTSSLFDLIKSPNSHLLFIGCSFPEWLFKFFIRVFSKDWSDFDNTSRNKFLADCLVNGDQHRTMFLSNYRFKVYPGQNVSSFVEELHSRWSQNQGFPNTQVRDYIVFISYASQDSELVKIVNRIFKEYKIDVWFDHENLDFGNQVKPELRANIDKACVFVPVITNTSLIKRNQGDFLLEWDYAVRRNRQSKTDQSIVLEIFPIVIDLQDYNPIPQGAFGDVKEEFWSRRQLTISEYTLRNTDDFSNDNQIDKFMIGIRNIQRKYRKP